MLSCRSKGIWNPDIEMATHLDLEGSIAYHDPLEGEDEVKSRSIIKD